MAQAPLAQPRDVLLGGVIRAVEDPWADVPAQEMRLGPLHKGMLCFLEWLCFSEGQRPSIPSAVLQGYELAFKESLRKLIRRTQEPSLRAKFEDMLDCPIRDNSGQCRSFTDYILSALINNGIHTRYDIEASFQYVAEKML